MRLYQYTTNCRKRFYAILFCQNGVISKIYQSATLFVEPVLRGHLQLILFDASLKHEQFWTYPYSWRIEYLRKIFYSGTWEKGVPNYIGWLGENHSAPKFISLSHRRYDDSHSLCCWRKNSSESGGTGESRDYKSSQIFDMTEFSVNRTGKMVVIANLNEC